MDVPPDSSFTFLLYLINARINKRLKSLSDLHAVILLVLSLEKERRYLKDLTSTSQPHIFSASGLYLYVIGIAVGVPIYHSCWQ